MAQSHTTRNVSATTSLARDVLKTCRLLDENAQIVDVVRSLSGTLVRIKPSTDGLAGTLRRALNTDIPLASIAIVESVLSGSAELQVVVPDGVDATHIARKLAQKSSISAMLRRLTYALVFGSFASFVGLLAREML